MSSAARVVARLAVIGLVLVVLSIVGTQYARILGRNMALASELHAVRGEVTQLEGDRARKTMEIRRLQSEGGALPEIHDKLRVVGDGEAIIYVKHAGERREAP